MASRSIEQTNSGYDWGLLTIVATLVALGVVMVFSASFAVAIDLHEDPYYFIARQVLWTSLGLVTLFVAARIRYTVWERWSIPLMALTLVALMTVIAFGSTRYGSTRHFFGGSVQPSEPAKIAIIIYISTWLASKGRRIRDVQVGLLPFSVLLGAITVLIVAQPDISTSALIVATACIMFFIAGAALKQLFVVGLGTAATFWLVVSYSDYAGNRIDNFLLSIKDPVQSPVWQVWHGVQALLRGGIFGTGVGNSTAKMPGFLPLSWSDNIFAVIGEEMGVLGSLLVVMLFTMLAYRGLHIALNARDNFGMLLATGITSLLVLQALLNTAVIVAVAPPTGVTLPFISYGGSSLVTALGAIGILLSIGRYSTDTAGHRSQIGQVAYARFDFGWRNRWPRLSRTRGGRSTRKSSPAKRRGGKRATTTQRRPARSRR